MLWYVSQRWGSLEMYSSIDTKDRPEAGEGGGGGGEEGGNLSGPQGIRVLK